MNEIYSINQLKKQKGLTIIDCGAHIGITSRYFLESFNVAKLICLEPDQRNFEILQKNIKVPNTHLHHNLISTEQGNYPFKEAQKSYNSRMLEESFDYLVKGITMNDIIEVYGLTQIDLLKIDIEGAEKELFIGDLSWLKMVDHLVIELHHDFSIQKLKDTLTPFGFIKIKAMDQSGDVYLASKQIVPS